MNRQSISVLILVSGLLAAATLAEVPNQSRSQLEKRSTHIVVGRANHVYTSESEGERKIETVGVVELLIDRVEKGEGLKAGQVVYGRFWKARLKPGAPPEPSSNGHRGLPQKGDVVRMYLRKADDGGYDVAFPNGTASPN